MSNYSRLSKRQKRLLYWIAEREGRFKSQKSVSLVVTWEAVEAVGAIGNAPEIVPPEIVKKPVRPKGIPLDIAAFTGHDPSHSERNGINRALATLEQRGLIKRGRHKGAKQRTTHVKLTRAGVDAVKAFVEGEA